MLRRRRRVSAQCPSYSNTPEDQIHVLSCISPSRRSLRTSLLLELEVWLNSDDTVPQIVSFLLSVLHLGFQHPRRPRMDFAQQFDASFYPAALAQLEIGWSGLLCGFSSCQMVHFQHEYFESLSSRRTGCSWVRHIVSKLWHIVHSLWTHRYSCLHDSQAINIFHGLSILRSSVQLELRTGVGSLPPSYPSYFTLSHNLLLKKPTPFLKGWFLVIRSARERYHTTFPSDEFTHNATLRQWVGLGPPT